ncbi:MAG: hypothetical protein GQ574_17060 [Crocinitomix sp.]|nr:hypothetical protein [Crocinitomix sp.]
MKFKCIQPLLLVALFSFFSFPGFTQDYPGIKAGEIQKLEGTTYGIIKHKKKVGLYDFRTEKFIVPLQKSFFYHYPQDNFLFILDKDNLVSAYDLKLADTACFIAQNDEELLLNIKNRTFSQKKGASRKAVCYNYQILAPLSTSGKTILPEDEQLIRERKNLNSAFTGLKLMGNSLIIYHHIGLYRNPNDVPLKSLQYTDEDSVIYDPRSGFYNAVYPPDIPSVNKSGVRSLKTGEWQIEPKYQKIYLANGYYICLSAYKPYTKDAYYDIYKQTGKEINPTEFMGIKSNSEIAMQIFSQNVLTPDRDSTFYYTKSDQGLGLINLQLFHEEYTIDYSKKEDGDPDLRNEVIFDPTYEFTHKIGPMYNYGSTKHFFMAYGDNGFELANFYDQSNSSPIVIKDSVKFYSVNYQNYNIYEVDGIAYNDTCEFKGFGYCLTKSEDQKNTYEPYLELKKYGDSLISVKYYVEELADPYAEPMKAWLHPDEDSVSLNPVTGFYEVVYPPNDPGSYESGIYDLRTKKWLIDPENAWVLRSNEGFLICKPVLNNAYNIIRYEYSFLNNDGTYLFENIQEKALQENIDYKHLLPPYLK